MWYTIIVIMLVHIPPWWRMHSLGGNYEGSCVGSCHLILLERGIQSAEQQKQKFQQLEKNIWVHLGQSWNMFLYAGFCQIMQGATQSLLVVKIINTASFYFKALCLFRRIEAGWSPKALYCLPWPDKKASFHYVHSSYLLTTSNHHITAHYQQPCPLITVHPSTEGEQGQSRFKSNWHTSPINLKMFQLQVGVLSCQGDFTLDILAAEWAVSQCSVAFWGKRDTNFHEGGTRLPKPIASSGQSWTKGTGAEEKGNHWHTGILQQKWKPSAKCVQWRRVEVWGGGEGVEWQSRQTDTKRPCVNAAALRLKIMNTKIICNLSGSQHTRSAPLAALLSVILTLSGWMCECSGVSAVWKGFGGAPQPHKEPLCESGL